MQKSPSENNENGPIDPQALQTEELTFLFKMIGVEVSAVHSTYPEL
jgi:hypothetical protein